MLPTHYLIRAKADGRYLTVHARQAAGAESSYLLLFREQFEALSYLNTHASDVSERFAVEAITDAQLVQLIKRWGFTGLGMVKDPLLPEIQFLSYQ